MRPDVIKKALLDKEENPADHLPKLYDGSEFTSEQESFMQRCFTFQFDDRPSATEVVKEVEILLRVL